MKAIAMRFPGFSASRRRFGQQAGALVALFSLAPFASRAQTPLPSMQKAPLPVSFRENPRLNGWIRVDERGHVTVFTGKAELGQGILTAQTQIAAEQMDVDFSSVSILSADTSRGPNEGYTYGSQSVEQSGAALQAACAQARAVLVGTAARQLGVPADGLTVRAGVIHAPDGRSVRYGDLVRGDLAAVLGMSVDAVDVIHVPGSGCYGHNGADDAALDAALLARAVAGRPVKLQWMRDDEFAWAPISPAMSMRIRAALTPQGRIADWQYDVWSNTHAARPGQPGGINLLAAWHVRKPFTPSPFLRIPQPYGNGDRNAVSVYALPRQHVVNHLLLDSPIRTSSLRTLGAFGNIFAIESFMDELAKAANADPAAFRRAHLTDPRAGRARCGTCKGELARGRKVAAGAWTGSRVFTLQKRSGLCSGSR
ncbi:MAG: Uncharacterized aldehyde oxidase, molybdopterin-binding subunit [uncultured Paraburkholderia sp.]|nr:MAG: Uncharacterized aldehyde oxidase, molybdopterin-binding subunit [uncultured Paraburkholderia sp.]